MQQYISEEKDKLQQQGPRISVEFLKKLVRSNFKLYYSTYELN